MQNKNNKQKGYTIIETMIAISIFLIVITIGMGALLNASLIHGKSENMRSLMDNLSFIMDDMSRNIRTGSDYNLNNNNRFSFKSSDGSQWVYFIGQIDGRDGIFKSTNGGGDFVKLNADEIVIDSFSGFTVYGAEPPPDLQQPFVTIRLSGDITFRNSDTNFSLQTSVSQRLIDIETTP